MKFSKSEQNREHTEREIKGHTSKHLQYKMIMLSRARTIFFTIFQSSVPQAQKKCRKNIQNENTKYICDLLPK